MHVNRSALYVVRKQNYKRVLIMLNFVFIIKPDGCRCEL